MSFSIGLLTGNISNLYFQVDDIESKLDNFIELYKQDRKRFLTLPLLPDNSHSNNPNLPPLPPTGPGGGAAMISTDATAGGSLRVRKTKHNIPSTHYVTLLQNNSVLTLIIRLFQHFQPKPILIDKQFSEPNSPITKTFDQQHQQTASNVQPQHLLTSQGRQNPLPIQRGLSDLGNRMKKRVTLR